MSLFVHGVSASRGECMRLMKRRTNVDAFKSLVS